MTWLDVVYTHKWKPLLSTSVFTQHAAVPRTCFWHHIVSDVTCVNKGMEITKIYFWSGFVFVRDLGSVSVLQPGHFEVAIVSDVTCPHTIHIDILG